MGVARQGQKQTTIGDTMRNSRSIEYMLLTSSLELYSEKQHLQLVALCLRQTSRHVLTLSLNHNKTCGQTCDP